jgi:hypothetical protein
MQQTNKKNKNGEANQGHDSNCGFLARGKLGVFHERLDIN